MSMVITRWWWLRHAPLAAPPGLIAGQADIPADLSDKDRLASAARRLPAGAIWITTPLCRSLDTASALGGTAPLPEPALMEQHFGDWQGLTHDAVWQQDQPAAQSFWDDPAHARPPGGESFADLCARVADAVINLSGRHAGRDIVAVAHAGTIRAAIGQALDIPPAKLLVLAADPLHLTRIDHIALANGQVAWRLVSANIPPC